MVVSYTGYNPDQLAEAVPVISNLIATGESLDVRNTLLVLDAFR